MPLLNWFHFTCLFMNWRRSNQCLMMIAGSFAQSDGTNGKKTEENHKNDKMMAEELHHR